MEKIELKAGYSAVDRNGDWGLFIPLTSGLTFIRENGIWTDANLYQRHKDFLHDGDNIVSEYDLMKVYGCADLSGDALDAGPNRRALLWERKEVKEVTMAEVCEKFGCEVKIVEG